MIGRWILCLVLALVAILILPTMASAQCANGACYTQVTYAAIPGDPVIVEAPDIVAVPVVRERAILVNRIESVRTVVHARPVRFVAHAVTVRAPVWSTWRFLVGRRICPLCE